MGQIELLNPVAKASVAEKTLAKPLPTLNGKTIGVVDSFKNWRGFLLFTKRVGELLSEKYGVEGIINMKSVSASGAGNADKDETQTEKKQYDELARKIDCAILGSCF